ncbi:hypothetical protein [Faecalibaculum rodentium]|mgnify:CR=1 FL=1|uniref:Uncharacterized protein n=1 Tax=Faecalibaculum rodentium TaxID=1702221 RepID=A0A140DSX3_9FIRM|nr:hypothetical protein [Faecalibaculum rodentium]AMK53750.1 hypothetical protein AALO17_06160 [Faecalibaculum rodentium]OLU44526.1 hypothetical protein BO223_08040 [Faecalibaculum rodentium]
MKVPTSIKEYDLQRIIEETAIVRDMQPNELSGFLNCSPELKDRLDRAQEYDYKYLLEEIRALCQRYADERF